MKITINNKTTVKELCEDFSRRFPYLKLVFLLPHANDLHLEARRCPHSTEPVVIAPEMKVAELEKTFLEAYNMPVRIFRKSGKLWLGTSLTNNWSLAEQDRQGENLSSKAAEPEK